MTAELLDADLPLSQLGEGAFWSSRNSTLYWVDIVGQTVHAYHLPDNLHSSWRVSKEVSFAFPQQKVTCWLVFVTGFTITILKAVRRCQSPFSIFRVAIA
jgi:sugar lactone lactonase YvrE